MAALTDCHKLTDLKHTLFFSYGFEGQKSKMRLTGLKSSCQQGCSFWRPQRKNHPHLFQGLSAVFGLWPRHSNLLLPLSHLPESIFLLYSEHLAYHIIIKCRPYIIFIFSRFLLRCSMRDRCLSMFSFLLGLPKLPQQKWGTDSNRCL